MKTLLLIFSFVSSTSLFAQMEVGSVWKMTGNAATFLESNNIDSTKMYFLTSNVFQLTYLMNDLPNTETSTWTDSGTNQVTVTYDPDGLAFGSNCPLATSLVTYSISSDVLTMTNVSGNCSLANTLLTNSTWNKVGETANLNENAINGISVYPNPTNSSIYVNATVGINMDELKIYDLLGKEVDFVSTPIQANQLEINVSTFPKGWYFIDLNAEYKQPF